MLFIATLGVKHAVPMACGERAISWPLMGPTIPCRPFVYGARVVPSGAFFIDFAGQNVKEEDGILHPQIGVTVQPTRGILTEWAGHVLDEYELGKDGCGGWAPHRSIVCDWGTGELFYYKGDDIEEQHDLLWLGQRSDFVEAPLSKQHEVSKAWSMFRSYLDIIEDKAMLCIASKNDEVAKRNLRVWVDHYSFQETMRMGIQVDANLLMLWNWHQTGPQHPRLQQSLPEPGNCMLQDILTLTGEADSVMTACAASSSGPQNVSKKNKHVRKPAAKVTTVETKKKS